jgi:hypothetical protein
MKPTKKMIGALLIIGIIATIPAAMCTEIPTTHPLAGIINSAGNTITQTHPLAGTSDHWDSSGLTLSGKSCKRQFAEQALQRNFWGMIRVGLFCPTTVYSN